MSEASTDRADRPAEVTDPLLWGLSATVADAHQPDDDRICVSPSCVGAAWPCAAWNNAQEGLRAARTPRPAGAAPATAPAGPAADEHHDPLTGWSTDLVPAARRQTLPQPAHREQLAVTSAA
ncbi:hypothetical protein [Micromonospora auratinigra]|uniref:Uncharacterized protein n=1 Tax=Micromonospora auratinigra TaxID=261654 RepID=A0A1A8Z986_9ACTN|nr:hypothetical protein [Micromonospora auratinigra]SBT40420.1 hypothetical protein GA0070611_1256 [Micromonospora auratinigra]